MKKEINHFGHDLIICSVLRRMLHVFDAKHLTYDTDRAARCNDLVLAEIKYTPERPLDNSEYYMERIFHGKKGLIFKAEEPRPGLIAVAVGNRYAPKSLIGGLYNPITGRVNGEIRGGSDVYDLGTYNLVGFINHIIEPRQRGRMKVLGTLLDRKGKPFNTEDFRVRWKDAAVPRHGLGVLVCGSAMDSGKTSCCTALAKGLRSRGLRVTFEKKTGTGSFRDGLRTCLEDHDMSDMTGPGIEVDYTNLSASDFVESAGRVSDVSGPLDQFVYNSLLFTPGFLADRKPDLHIVELADNLSHLSNLALLQHERFRDLFQAIIYVPVPSFDTVHHFLHFLRKELHWHDIPVAFSGPIANESQWVVLREEITERLGLPCLPSLTSVQDLVYDTDSLTEWVLHKISLKNRQRIGPGS